MLVCHCTVVNDRRLRELIADGAVDLLDVAAACGAGSFCGGCVPTIASLLSEATGEPASAILDRAPSSLDDADEVSLPTRLRQVVRAIQEQFRADGWRVGAPVASEEALGRRHDATRGVVRDALHVLREHGIVRATDDSGRGLVVGAPDADAISAVSALHLRAVGTTPEEVLETRRVVEGLAIHCACEHPDPAAWHQFVQATRDSSALLLDGPEFHHALASVSGNPALPLLVAVLMRLHAPAALMVSPEARARGPDHTFLAAAIAVRDRPRAARLLAAHIDTSHDEFRPPPTGTPLALAQAIMATAARRGLHPGDVIGTERDVAEQIGVDPRRLRDVVPLLEYHVLVTRQPGPRATLALATPDPWPTAELLALYLDRAGVEPGQLLHVRHALEVRAVELASARIDQGSAMRLRRRLDEETTVLRRARVRHHMFHTIHPLLVRLSGNRPLAHCALAVNLALVRRANRDPELARFLSSGVGEGAHDHAAIVDAAMRGDATTGRRLMQDHLEEREHS